MLCMATDQNLLPCSTAIAGCTTCNTGNHWQIQPVVGNKGRLHSLLAARLPVHDHRIYVDKPLLNCGGGPAWAIYGRSIWCLYLGPVTRAILANGSVVGRASRRHVVHWHGPRHD